MGYTTKFSGEFSFNCEVDDETLQLLEGLANTRRMKRNPYKLAARLNLTYEEVVQKYGLECQLWYGDTENFGQVHTPDVVDYNEPPEGQPGLWLQWVVTEDREGICWDGGEKFYNASGWIIYLIKNVLAPRGYVLNGIVDARGEDIYDLWHISIVDNKVSVEPSLYYG
jgi:hypothetical protein